MDIQRGDIYYVKCDGALVTGSETRAGRPAVIVSNDKNNRFSTVVEVVYLTLQRKNALPTHTKVQCAGKIGAALCEQVTSVSTDRLSDLIGHCTPGELEQIDKAIMVSLGIEHYKREAMRSDTEFRSIAQTENLLDTIKEERDLYKNLYESLLNITLSKLRKKIETGRASMKNSV